MVAGAPSSTNEYPASPEPPASVDAVHANEMVVVADAMPCVCDGDDATGSVGGVRSGGGTTKVTSIVWFAFTLEKVCDVVATPSIVRVPMA